MSNRDHYTGNPDATVIMIEYGDFECPYCRHAYPLVKKLLHEKGNELGFIYRHFPLRKIHPNAFDAAIATEAAGRQGKFWEMYQVVFENQDRLSKDYLLLLADRIGLNAGQFILDRKNDEIINKVETDFESGMRSGVNRTPFFFLNGSPVPGYDGSYSSLEDAVNKMDG